MLYSWRKNIKNWMQAEKPLDFQKDEPKLSAVLMAEWPSGPRK